MDRRKFITLTGSLILSSLIPFGFSGWAAGVINPTDKLMIKNQNKSKAKLIVLFQRGAVDGLNLVIPYTESAYYDLRPTISIALPGSAMGAIGLDKQFALHPSLKSLTPYWQNKTLGFIHASGSPNPSRSHFEAQDYMETGTPGVRSTKDGWLNRLLYILTTKSPTIQGVSLGSISPLIYKGSVPVMNIPSRPSKPNVIDRPFKEKEFEKLYKNDPEIEHAFLEGVKSRKEILSYFEEERKEADHGAPSPTGFVGNCIRLGNLIAKDPTMQVAFLDVGGWDTHINQGSSSGQLASHLTTFGEGIHEIVKGLKETYKDTLIVVMSEFGRTVKENGRAGTDHGHGNVMWIMGGGIQGGKVYGDWPTLSSNHLYENRDLAVTTDFRSVLGYLIRNHFNLSEKDVNTIFPNATASNTKSNYKDLLTRVTNNTPQIHTCGC